MDAATEIKSIIRRINRATIGRQPDDIRPLFHPNVEFMSPDFTQRVRGREACLATYDEFTAGATILTFEPREPQVHIVGNTAVASTQFDIRYTMEEKTHEESGRDLMVFSEIQQAWTIVWRTVILLPRSE